MFIELVQQGQDGYDLKRVYKGFDNTDWLRVNGLELRLGEDWSLVNLLVDCHGHRSHPILVSNSFDAAFTADNDHC